MEPRKKVLMRFSGLVFGFSSLSSTLVSLRFSVSFSNSALESEVCLFSFLLILIGILCAWAWDFPAERTLPLPRSPGPPLNSRAELEKRPIAHHARDQVKITNFD